MLVGAVMETLGSLDYSHYWFLPDGQLLLSSKPRHIYAFSKGGDWYHRNSG